MKFENPWRKPQVESEPNTDPDGPRDSSRRKFIKEGLAAAGVVAAASGPLGALADAAEAAERSKFADKFAFNAPNYEKIPAGAISVSATTEIEQLFGENRTSILISDIIKSRAILDKLPPHLKEAVRDSYGFFKEGTLPETEKAVFVEYKLLPPQGGSFVSRVKTRGY